MHHGLHATHTLPAVAHLVEHYSERYNLVGGGVSHWEWTLWFGPPDSLPVPPLLPQC